MGKKRELIKEMRKRRLDDGQPALVVCVGKHCCERAASRAVLEAARVHAAGAAAPVRVVAVACLDICKKGPIVATYPAKKFKKRADAARVRALIDKLQAS